MSFGFRSGSTPVKTDSRWVRWAKILTHYQGQSGADSRNDLRQTDPLRMLKVKVLRSLAGASGFVPPAYSPTAPAISFIGETLQGDNVDFPEHPADEPHLDSWQGAESATGTGDPDSDPGEWNDLGAAGVADGSSSAWSAAVVSGHYGAVRVRIGGVWSPWGKALNIF